MVKSIAMAFVIVAVGALNGEIPQERLSVYPPMYQIYHPVSTKSIEAQKSFDTGLTNIYAFNFDIAFASFKEAATHDPNLAMAFWGMALALGQNINADIEPDNRLKAYDFVQKAVALAPQASKSEQAYISALAKRYTNDMSVDAKTLRAPYSQAMKKVFEEYHEDLDAGTLYAGSLLEVDSWEWWAPNERPNKGTKEAIDVLNFILLRNPDHIGANHYNIHALEQSPYPERALMSAHRLLTLDPDAAHLLHVPCHIFLLVGDYETCVKTSKKAIAQDLIHYNRVVETTGKHPIRILPHNIFVLSRAYMLMEDYKNALDTAMQLVEYVEPFIETMPDMTDHYTAALDIYLYFNKWNEILAYKIPGNYPSAQAFLHYSKAMAYVALGDQESAQQEQTLMLQEKEKIQDKSDTKAVDYYNILLDASFSNAQEDFEKPIELLREAAELQENQYFDEPTFYHVPARQLLGFALLKQKKYAEAQEAFQTALKSLQRNGRTLFGLSLALKGQQSTIDAYWIDREMTAALKYATEPLKLENMW